MAIVILNEMSTAGALLSPFMRPVLYFSVSGAAAVTNPSAEIVFDGTTEDVTFDAVHLETASSVHYFAVDLSDVMPYLLRSFDGGNYPDDLEFINGNLLQKFDEYFRSLEIDIYFERGTANQQTGSIANYWLYLANQMPFAGGFRLTNVENNSCMQALKWSKNTYNALFFWAPAGALSIVKGGGSVIAALTADDTDVTADSDITADSEVGASPAGLTVEYGYRYNWYAANDVRNIAAIGWGLPSMDDYEDLILTLDPDGGLDVNTAGGDLKETGTEFWNSPNTGATNISLFNARGAGVRNAFANGEPNDFDYIGLYEFFWTTNDAGISGGYDRGGGPFLLFNSASLVLEVMGITSTAMKLGGASVRLIKNSTILTHGQTGTYVGNDGKVYRTICIGTQEWLADNLCETLYRDGSPIPEVTDDAAWAALTTGARCSYNNDEANAFTEDDPGVTIASETVTAGYYQLKFAKTSVYLDKGANTITITTPAGSKSIIIYFDPDCPNYIPVLWQHPLLGYVSFPFTGSRQDDVSAKKLGEIGKVLTTMVNVNTLKEITGYEATKKVSLTTKADAQFWPLLEALYHSRHVYLFVGADGAEDSSATWIECEVSGGCSFKSDRARATFNVELTLPETFNVRF